MLRLPRCGPSEIAVEEPAPAVHDAADHLAARQIFGGRLGRATAAVIRDSQSVSSRGATRGGG